MKVTLIDYTGVGCEDPDHAINVLIFTKQTRLKMSAGGLDEIAQWPRDKKITELEYMANTIPSSWEFVDYTFMIEGVTRAFTHQLVRTRTASFAQQTMRVLDVDGWQYLNGPTVSGQFSDPNITGSDLRKAIYDEAMKDIAGVYNELIKLGAKIEDARGVLPTNILTNIVMKLNMRNFVDLVRKRSSSRTQDEYRDVLHEMKQEVLEVHPWMHLFMEKSFDKAANELDHILRETEIPADKRTHMIKLIDQMRARL